MSGLCPAPRDSSRSLAVFQLSAQDPSDPPSQRDREKKGERVPHEPYLLNMIGDIGKRGPWSTPEHERYIAAMCELLSARRVPWKEVATRVGTRSPVQCKTHHQKFLKALKNGRACAPRTDHRELTEDELITGFSPVFVTKFIGMPEADSAEEAAGRDVEKDNDEPVSSSSASGYDDDAQTPLLDNALSSLHDDDFAATQPELFSAKRSPDLSALDVKFDPTEYSV